MASTHADESERNGAAAHEKAFGNAEYADRLGRLRTGMAAAGIDLLYVTSPASMCWLHGYTANWYRHESPRLWPAVAGTAVRVDSDRLIHFDSAGEDDVLDRTSVVTDVRFVEHEEDGDVDGGVACVLGALRAEGWLSGAVGLELWSPIPNPAISARYQAALAAAGCAVADGSGVLRDARRLKSATEIACIEEGVRLADIGLRAAQAALRVGVSELEVQGEIARAMHAAGSETSAIPIMLIPWSKDGHQMTSRRRLEAGDHLAIDVCGVFNRYHGNVMRAFYLGDPPAEAVDRYARAAGAFEIVRSMVKPGAPIAPLNRELKRYYEQVGLWGQRGWGLGYELGVAFPPDWVGEFVFTVGHDDQAGAFLASEVANYESIFATGLIDTFVCDADGARFLSDLPLQLIPVD
jgi:Xaa-Pro aminopeptidase